MIKQRMIRQFLAGIWLLVLYSLPGAAQTVPQPAPDEVRNIDDAFEKGFLLVSGLGVGGAQISHAGQRKVMALRAAQVLAYRELLEAVQGISISSETTVNQGLADEVVRARIEGVVQGAQTVYKHYDPQEDVATVYVRLPLKGVASVAAAMLPALKTLPPPPGSVPFAAAAYISPPTAAALPADGLIVDARAHPFRPALINRILTAKGEILYDPTTIAQDILVQRGSGDYTTDTGKAQAILSQHGSANPLTVTPQRLLDGTNIELSDADVAAVFAADAHTHFLAGAKVVFVMQ